MSLVLNNIVIESRASDCFINATQMCKAGGKQFAKWYRLATTKELINTLITISQNNSPHVHIWTCEDLVNTSKSKHIGTWIHPDLAVQLAQWISPVFAIQVSGWVRELVTTGSVSIESKASDEELMNMQRQLMERERELAERDNLLQESKTQLAERDSLLQESKEQIEKLERKQLQLSSYVENIQLLEKEQVFYIATTTAYAMQHRFKYGGVKNEKDLRSRLASYNTGRADGDLFFYTKQFKCNNYRQIEDRIGSILIQFKDRLESRKEMLHLRYDSLIEIVDFICNNYDKELDYINARCKEFLNNTIENVGIVPEPIVENQLVVAVQQNGHITRSKKIDVTGWTGEQINKLFEEIINLCAAEHKQIEYDFSSQKDDIDLELNWGWLSNLLAKRYRGRTRSEWIDTFKEWFTESSRPARLRVRNIGLL
jgi:hypothetical protein